MIAGGLVVGLAVVLWWGLSGGGGHGATRHDARPKPPTHPVTNPRLDPDWGGTASPSPWPSAATSTSLGQHAG